jgi:hypothetical protein
MGIGAILHGDFALSGNDVNFKFMNKTVGGPPRPELNPTESIPLKNEIKSKKISYASGSVTCSPTHIC